MTVEPRTVLARRIIPARWYWEVTDGAGSILANGTTVTQTRGCRRMVNACRVYGDAARNGHVYRTVKAP